MSKHKSSEMFSSKISELPVGAIFQTIVKMEEPPRNWMRTEGQKLIIKKYPRLFKAMGHMYSEDKDNKEYFNLPNTVRDPRFYIMKVKE